MTRITFCHKGIAFFAGILFSGLSCQSTGSASSEQNPTALAGEKQTDEFTREALLSALDDERKAEATYAAVISKFGAIRPFSNIIQAEVQHQRVLLMLLEEYGVPTPPNPYNPATLPVPTTVTEACNIGVNAELDNIAIYDRLIPKVGQSDIRSAFAALRSASADRHLPAFERCVHPGNGPGRRG